MTVVLRSSSLFLTLLGIVSNARVAKADAVLRRGAVGRMRIGMRLEELEATINSVVEHSTGGKIAIYSGEKPIATADITNGVVSQFKILSQRFRTDIGIGIGVPLRVLARSYAVSWVAPGWAYVDSLKMRFEIRDGRVASIVVS